MKTSKEQFWASHAHRLHCPGVPQAEERLHCEKRFREQLTEIKTPGPARAKSDLAWLVMLVKQGLVSKEVGARLLPILKERTAGGEDFLKRKLDGDEDMASVVNLGRTLQEPMSRLQLRAKLLDVLERMHKCLGTILDVADANVDTLMAGQTHLSHAQPTTYAGYLLSVYDGLARGLEQLELAYRHTNRNSGGCGALAGTGWPVDRHFVTELLGFAELVEPAYDCEAGQDHALTILFALTNIGVLLSRTAMDFNIWIMEEVMMFDVAMEWRGVSSMMPQKAIPGSQFERIRLEASDVVGAMITGVVSSKGEPHSDMLPIYEGWRSALPAMCHIEKALGFFAGLLPSTTPNKEQMLRYAREGFAATPDLAVILIRDKGYGGRRAHRICATMVRIARERGIKAFDTTGELLDEAARIADETPPCLSTAQVRDALDPVQSLKRHTNVGDPHPDESRRMIGLRRTALDEARQRHTEKLRRLEEADRKLAAEIEAIIR